MKQAADHFTRDFLDTPKRGRPRKPDAKTDAQRAREYRARKRSQASDIAALSVPEQHARLDASIAESMRKIRQQEWTFPPVSARYPV